MFVFTRNLFFIFLFFLFSYDTFSVCPETEFVTNRNGTKTKNLNEYETIITLKLIGLPKSFNIDKKVGNVISVKSFTQDHGYDSYSKNGNFTTNIDFDMSELSPYLSKLVLTNESIEMMELNVVTKKKSKELISDLTFIYRNVTISNLSFYINTGCSDATNMHYLSMSINAKKLEVVYKTNTNKIELKLKD